MPTIRDVAKHAGVSIATVSRVINESGFVSEELRSVVLKAMQDLHFQPSALAKGLKTASSKTIGMIVLDLSNSQLAHLCYSVGNRLFHWQYLPLICSSESNPDTEQRYVDLLLSHRVDGIIINSCQPREHKLARISRTIPMVAVYRRIQDPDYIGDFIDSDGTNGTYALTRHLLQNGHRKIYIINGPLNTSAGYDRFRGFCQAMEEFGIPVDEHYPYQIETDYTCSDGFRAMEAISLLEDRPTAIVTTNPETQIGLLHCCKERNLKIPDDFSLVSYAPSNNTELMFVEPTCAIQDHRVIGQRASDLILERIANPKLPNREIIYPCPIVYGNTVKPL